MVFKSDNKRINNVVVCIGLLFFSGLIILLIVQTFKENDFTDKLITGLFSLIILSFIIVTFRKYRFNITSVSILGDELTYNYFFNIKTKTISLGEILHINKTIVTHFDPWDINLAPNKHNAHEIILKNGEIFRLVEYYFINYPELIRKVSRFEKMASKKENSTQ
jgi:branched-subunit amino acid transport protein AzlD